MSGEYREITNHNTDSTSGIELFSPGEINANGVLTLTNYGSNGIQSSG
jgi:hypothetical protein